MSDVRSLMLQVIGKTDPSEIQSRVVINSVLRELGKRGTEIEQAVLTCWHDLMRTGVLAWGLNALNPDPPFAHLTELGRRTLGNLSRDPANPDGYLAAISGSVPAGSIPHSYVVEALATYNAGCFKAAAVMIGAAAESLVVDVRGEIQSRLQALGKQVSRDLQDWRIKRVLDAVEAECTARKKDMPRGLDERFDAFWSSFTGQLRLARNDAGHPISIVPVSVDMVHGGLLIFPELAKLVAELIAWVRSPSFT